MKMHEIIIKHYQDQLEENIIWVKRGVCLCAKVCDHDRFASLLRSWAEAEAKNGTGHSDQYSYFHEHFSWKHIHP
jgi:hypothetical protein